MADPRFFDRAGPFSLAELSRIAEATLSPDVDPSRLIHDVGPLDTAGPDQLSFLDNRRYADSFSQTRAGACLVHPDLASRAPQGTVLLLTRKPYRGYALCAQAFYPAAAEGGEVSALAHIDPTATVGPGCSIAAGVVIEAGAEIGPRCRIGANAVIGRNVQIGADCTVGACASLTHCILGQRVYVYTGARIGQDGFGFAMDAVRHVRVPQLGRVLIEDDVEIGANVTIDRGAGPDTIIGRGSMIDNLVQIGHNVQLGPGCVIVAQAGISGSTRLDHHVVLAAQGGIAGHLTIGAGARIAAQSGIMRDVPAGQEVMGSPAVPIREFFRRFATLDRISRRKEKDGRED